MKPLYFLKSLALFDTFQLGNVGKFYESSSYINDDQLTSLLAVQKNKKLLHWNNMVVLKPVGFSPLGITWFDTLQS
jgi:hypothetical protein